MRKLMSKMNRRGLSDVITTVLIILLVLAAVVLIWTFIRRPITQGGESIELQSECFKVELEPTGCVVTDLNGTKNAAVNVQWKSGNTDLTALRFIVSSDTGANNVSTVSSGLELLGTVSGTVGLTGVSGTSYTLSAAGQVKTKSGVEGYCPESVTKLACTAE